MSIAANMKLVTLQIREVTQNKSMQKKETWKDLKPIKIAIFPTGGGKNQSNNQEYTEDSYTGITFEKGLKKIIHRLKDNEDIYEIDDAIDRGKLREIKLSKVTFNG